MVPSKIVVDSLVSMINNSLQAPVRSGAIRLLSQLTLNGAYSCTGLEAVG